MDKNGGSKNRKTAVPPCDTSSPKLQSSQAVRIEDVGITYSDSSRWQSIAKMSETICGNSQRACHCFLQARGASASDGHVVRKRVETGEGRPSGASESFSPCGPPGDLGKRVNRKGGFLWNQTG
jgi:hypothetical protein